MDNSDEIEALYAEARNDLALYQYLCEPTYIPSRFYNFIAHKFEAVERGEINRLILNTPPQRGKSKWTSVGLTTWLLGRDPTLRIVCASYTQNLANRNSREARERMDSEVYRDIFKTRIKEGNTAVENWGVEGGGYYKAVGIGGSLTGYGCDCLLPETKIVTDKYGTISIKDIEVVPESCKVLAYDEQQQNPVFKAIKNFASREATGFYRITTSSGRVVEATGEHPFFTGDRYKRADQLAIGDPLLRLVQGGFYFSGGGYEEMAGEREGTSFLQQAVCGESLSQSIWEEMPRMRQSRKSKELVLLGRMQQSVSKNETRQEDSDREYIKDSGLSSMQQGIYRDNTSAPFGEERRDYLLRLDVRLQRARVSDDGRQQSGMEERYVPVEVSKTFGESVSDNAPIDSRTGRIRMRNLRRKKGVGDASYQYRSIGQSMVEPRNDVFEMLIRRTGRNVRNRIGLCGLF